MRKLNSIIAILLITATVWAQSPEKISYQAVVRDANNALVTNQQVGMQISILQGSASGTEVYLETQTPTTNANGLVSIEIGTSTSSDDFSAINWANSPYFLKTEIDPAGGTNYSITGTSQLLSVPYALHAKTAETVTGGITETDPVFNAWNRDYNDLSNKPSAISDFAMNANSQNITNLASPANAQDAATKSYVDVLKNILFQVADPEKLIQAGVSVEELVEAGVVVAIQKWNIGSPDSLNVTATLYSNDSLVIEGTGEMKEYGFSGDANAAPWNSIKMVNILDGVTNIGKLAFDNCRELSSVNIPNSVTSIDYYAFYFCSSLSSIYIPDNLTDIYNLAFQECTNLTEINVSADNPQYSSDDGVVYNKDKSAIFKFPMGRQGSFTIPNSVIEILTYAFSESNLETVVIPNTVTNIGLQSFAVMNRLKSINIPSSVITIGDGAFMDDGALESIFFPASVTSIGNEPFRYNNNLASLTVDENNQYYTSEDNVLFDKDKTRLIYYCKPNTDSDYVIPSTVTIIEDMAFNFCENLKSVTLPLGLITIKNHAFYNSGLISLTNLSPVPQSILNTVFLGVNLNNITLIVPSGSLSAYQNADIWKDFGTIIEQ